MDHSAIYYLLVSKEQLKELVIYDLTLKFCFFKEEVLCCICVLKSEKSAIGEVTLFASEALLEIFSNGAAQKRPVKKIFSKNIDFSSLR